LLAHCQEKQTGMPSSNGIRWLGRGWPFRLAKGEQIRMEFIPQTGNILGECQADDAWAMSQLEIVIKIKNQFL